MESLVTLIENGTCRGVVRSSDGTLSMFENRGVVDLYRMVVGNPGALLDSTVCDSVIGRGAALLLVYGRVKRVFAFTMSESARSVLENAGVECGCRNLVEHIINRAGTGICPVEMATMDVEDPVVALGRIGDFLREKGLI